MFCVPFGIWWTSWTNRAVFNSLRNTWLLTLIIMPESSPAARVRAALSGTQGSHKMEIRTHVVFAFENVSSVLPLVTGLRSTYTLQLLAKYSAGINSKMIHCCEVCTYGHLIRQKHLHFFIQKNHTFAFHKDLEKKHSFSTTPAPGIPAFKFPFWILQTTEEITFPILKGGRFVPVLTSHMNLNWV